MSIFYSNVNEESLFQKLLEASLIILKIKGIKCNFKYTLSKCLIILNSLT